MIREIRPTRRAFVAGAAAAALAAPRRPRAAGTVRVAAYGGVFERTLAERVYPAFSEAAGVTVESVPRESDAAWLARLEASVRAGAPLADVILVERAELLRAPRLFAPIAESAASNLARAPERLVVRDGAGAALGAPAMTWYTTFVTNTQAWPEPPASWADAWDAKFAGALGWSRDLANGYTLEIAAAAFFGGPAVMETEAGLLRCLEKAAELKANVRLWYRDEARFDAMLLAGELTGGQYFHDATTAMIAHGAPLRSTFPAEGGVVGVGSWCLAKGAGDAAAGHAFVDWALTPEAQTLVAERLGAAPVLPREELPGLGDAAFARVTSPNEPIVPNYRVHLEKGAWLAARWEELLGDS